MYSHYEEEQTVMADAVLRGLDPAEALTSPMAWERLAEIGLPLLAMPETQGGMGARARTFHAVAEALGRRLQTSPFATSALAATKLVDQLAQEPLRGELLSSLVSGRTVLAMALGESQTDYDLEAVQTQAEPTATGWRLSGRKVVALHSGQASSWIVSARSPSGGFVLLLMQEGMPGLVVRRYACLDRSQACDLDFAGVEVDRSRQLGEVGSAALQSLRAALDLAELALCAESVGIQARLLDDTVLYAKERRQFGAAIGSFQSVQHRLADMLVALEQARSLAWLAASEFDTALPARRSYLISAAKARGIVSGRFIGMQSIHLHGGMGMTDDLPVGRGVKRLLAIEHSFGDERHHLARVAQTTSLASAASILS